MQGNHELRLGLPERSESDQGHRSYQEYAARTGAITSIPDYGHAGNSVLVYYAELCVFKVSLGLNSLRLLFSWSEVF